VFLRAKSERVNVNTFIRVSGVGLVRLDPREVRSFTLRETILAVKLELSDDDGVLSPAVHVKRGLRENECTGIRDTRVIKVRLIKSVSRNSNTTKINLIVGVRRTVPVSSVALRSVSIQSTSILEETTCINVCTRVSSDGRRSTKSMDGVRESINGIGVVEGLGTEDLEK
jgi:hypothetical protein